MSAAMRLERNSPRMSHRAVSRIEPLEPRRLLTVSGPLFNPPINAPAALTSASTIAAGDLDGDGKTDLAFVTGGYHPERRAGGIIVQVFVGQMRFLGGD